MIDSALKLIGSGLENLATYLAAHILLCLLPAFLIAGAMSALIPKKAITKFLGRDRPKYISYPASALAGFLLAICSCTVIPLFAGIYKKGAGLGPAITFLFVAPAINILALSYTGQVLGSDFAIARLTLSIVFGISIGMIMATIFKQQDLLRDQNSDTLFKGEASMSWPVITFFILLISLLIVGTTPVSILKQTYFQLELPFTSAYLFQDFLNQLIPFDPAKGEEGITVQGACLIGILVLIGLAAWKGIQPIFEGINKWTWVAVSLLGATLLFASLGIMPHSEGVTLLINGKFIGVTCITFALGWMLKKKFTEDQTRDFLWESWRFVKQIFPLLIIGVFTVGAVRTLINPQWIQSLAGENTISGNLVGVIFGVFMYFPTLVEVPIAQMFLDLGMHRGPLLAYLISDPELSLQSILITASIIGKKKAWVYVGLIAFFSIISGLLYGAWINGMSLGILISCLIAILCVLSLLLTRFKA